MIRRGDYRDRPEDYVPVAQRCVGPVVEIGPAFGEFSRYLPEDTQYVGVEIGNAFCVEARKRYPNRIFIEGDVIDLVGMLAGAFRTAVAMQVLEHWREPPILLNAMRTIANGRLILTTIRGPATPAQRQTDGHFSEWPTKDHLQRELEPYGKVEIMNGAEHHWIAVVDLAS